MNAEPSPESVSSNPPSQTLRVVDFNPENESDSWDRVFANIPSLSNSDLTSWDKTTLRQGLRGLVGSVIIEATYVCKDHRNLHSNFFSKKFNHPDAPCQRVHFFANRLTLPNESTSAVLAALFDKAYKKSYIGFSVIRPVGYHKIGRTVLDPNKLQKGLEQPYFCLTAKFKVHLGGVELYAHGYPFISQDAESMVCAHSAIWGVCRFLSQRYRIYKELYPYEIIASTKPDFGRTVPYRGMTYNDYSEILTRFGCHPVLLGKVQLAKNKEELRAAYAYIESGFPILASNEKHVFTLIGHTLPKKIPNIRPDKDGLISSAEFVDAFVVMDDNRFPYRRVTWAPPKRRATHKNSTPSVPLVRTIHIDDLRNLVVPLPEKVFLQAKHAEGLLKAHLNWAEEQIPPMAEVLKSARTGRGLVTRQFVTTSSAIKREALARYQHTKSGVFLHAIDLAMPHFVWVMELATLDGYKKHKCLGEIVIDATASPWLPDTLLFMRVDNSVTIRGNQSPEKDSKAFDRCRQFSHNLNIDNHMQDEVS